jgi:hypothetical protein
MSTQKFFASGCARPEWQRMKPFDQFAAMIDRNLDGITIYCVRTNNIARRFDRRSNKTIRDVHRDAWFAPVPNKSKFCITSKIPNNSLVKSFHYFLGHHYSVILNMLVDVISGRAALSASADGFYDGEIKHRLLTPRGRLQIARVPSRWLSLANVSATLMWHCTLALHARRCLVS